MSTNAPYVLATCRPVTTTIFDDAGRVQPERVDANVAEHCALIRRAVDAHDARLIVFPEFALSGHAIVNNDAWVAGGIEFPGPETDRIGQAARDANAYVVIQAAERHPAFPGRYFLSAALITPDGDIGIVYRKHYTLSLRTSPIEVYDRFVETFGPDAFFPVCDTPIGRIGLTIGAELHWPEVTRSLALNGAEIIANPIAAIASVDYMNRAGADVVRPARAFENMTYFAMANNGFSPSSPPSRIYDYEGTSIGHDAADGAPFTLATIDIQSLRAARAAPGANLITQLQPAIHAPLDGLPLWPANCLPDAPASAFDRLFAIETESWDRMQARWSPAG